MFDETGDGRGEDLERGDEDSGGGSEGGGSDSGRGGSARGRSGGDPGADPGTGGDAGDGSAGGGTGARTGKRRAQNALVGEFFDASLTSKCVEWDGCRDRDGYGKLRYQGRWLRAHRTAWETLQVPI